MVNKRWIHTLIEIFKIFIVNLYGRIYNHILKIELKNNILKFNTNILKTHQFYNKYFKNALILKYLF